MTTTFTLQCTGHGGTASASATVTLLGATGTVAGHLLVPTISRSDSDVNDPLVPSAPNDSDLQAQVMPNPVVIGGYVNLAGAGEPGHSFANGDPEDWYRMDLVAGQVIELVIPSASAFVGGDDADLRLFDSNLMIRGNSAGTGQVEQITVPQNRHIFHPGARLRRSAAVPPERRTGNRPVGRLEPELERRFRPRRGNRHAQERR